MSESLTLTAVFTPDEDGWTVAQLAEWPAVVTCGRTVDEAREMLVDPARYPRSTMPARANSFDLGRLRLGTGEGRRFDLEVALDPLHFGGERYAAQPAAVPVRLDVSRMTSSGYALRMRFEASVSGPCTRCLEPAGAVFAVDSWEVDQPGGGEELSSPYVEGAVLDLHAWARDALALALPPQVLCGEQCAGLCPVCGENLNEAGQQHGHERLRDPRWAKLSELKLE